MTGPLNSPDVKRRTVLQAAATAIPLVWTGAAVSAQEPGAEATASKSANDRVRMAIIGTGGQGSSNMRKFMAMPDVDIVGLADVDSRHLASAVGETQVARADVKVQAVSDYRALLDRDDIDAVVISTPDHWHALASVEAMQSGKDVYCEKPLANSVGEGRRMVDAAEKYSRVVQCGSHERSNPRIRAACEAVRSGKIGQVREVRVNLPTEQDHHQRVANYGAAPSPTQPPSELDYDRWLGPASWVPHIEDRVHFWWRFVLAFGGGEMTDRGAHIIDIAQLALGRDDTTPTKFMAVGNRSGGLYDAFMDYLFVNEYADGLRITGVDAGQRGVEFIGDNGRIMIHIHGGRTETTPTELVGEFNLDDGPLGRTESHHRNFIDCIRSRETPMASAAAGHRTATICHLNNIAMRLGKPLEFDPVSETITNDEVANAMLMPVMRDRFRFT
jgi:predicted dehydrogenase